MMCADRLLILLRHGDSLWNIENRFTGCADVPLSDQGRLQAAAAGKLRAALRIRSAEVHTSVMQRTQQTADELLSAAEHATVP